MVLGLVGSGEEAEKVALRALRSPFWVGLGDFGRLLSAFLAIFGATWGLFW